MDHSKTAIIWDLDGTLLDTLEDLKNATNYVLRTFGCPERTLDEVRRFVGNGARRLLVLAMPESSSGAEIDRALECFKTYYDAHCREHTGPYAGIPEALQLLKEAGYPMAVVSNKPDSAVQILCRDYFGDLFATTHGDCPGCARKPAPDLVLQTAAVLGVAPEHCIYVGDSDVDILTAANSGMICLSVLWGFRDRELLEHSGGSHFCADPADLPRAIRELEEIIHGK